MAMALSLRMMVLAKTYNAWYQRVVDLTPQTVWGQYSRGMLTLATNPSVAASALWAAIDAAPAKPEPYEMLLCLEERSLKCPDEVMRVLERMVAQPALVARAQPRLWRWHIERSGATDAAKRALRASLERASDTSDVAMLDAVRSTEWRFRSALVGAGVRGWRLHVRTLPGVPDFCLRPREDRRLHRWLLLAPLSKLPPHSARDE